MEELNKIINDVSWRFAKTYAHKAPHEYIIVDKKTDEGLHIYNTYLKNLDEHGYDFKFWSRVYRCINIGEYRYWMCGTKISFSDDSVIIVNRTCERLYAEQGLGDTFVSGGV